MANTIGLRDGLKFNKGAGLRWRIKTTYWELRYAWQRAWRGYDFTDVFELCHNFVARMPILLREFKEHNDALFRDVDKNDGSSLTEEQTDAVLDEMIFYFENCDEDVVYKRLYGTDPLDDFEEYQKLYFDRSKEVLMETHRCWNEAMRLFAKYSGCLWY